MAEAQRAHDAIYPRNALHLGAVAGAKLSIQQAVDFNRIEVPITEQQFDAFADVIWTAPQ